MEVEFTLRILPKLEDFDFKNQKIYVTLKGDDYDSEENPTDLYLKDIPNSDKFMTWAREIDQDLITNYLDIINISYESFSWDEDVLNDLSYEVWIIEWKKLVSLKLFIDMLYNEDVIDFDSDEFVTFFKVEQLEFRVLKNKLMENTKTFQLFEIINKYFN